MGRQLWPLIVCAMLLATTMPMLAQAQTASGLTAGDRFAYAKAFAAAEKRLWEKALDAAAGGDHTLATNYFRWLTTPSPVRRPRSRKSPRSSTAIKTGCARRGCGARRKSN